jgi:hypothetical protein
MRLSENDIRNLEERINDTRARFDRQTMNLLNAMKLNPRNQIIMKGMARRMEDFEKDAKDNPIVVLDQPGWENEEIWSGDISLGRVVGTGVPVNLPIEIFMEGGVMLITGGTRSAKSTIGDNLATGLSK